MVIEFAEEDEICIMRVEGRFVTPTDPDYLRSNMEELKRLNRGSVLLDLTAMPYIGSTGIGFIVGIFSSVTLNGGQFVLVGLQPRVQELFRLTRLGTIIPMVCDVEAGIAVLRATAPRAGAADAGS